MNRFTARQPVFNRRNNVVAYELLYRESMDNFFPAHVCDVQATSKVLVDAFLDTNIDRLSDGKSVLINFSEKALKDSFPEVAPSNKIIIEVLETVRPTEDVYQILRNLFHKGYKIAFDDFVYDERWERFLKFAKLVKFDIQATPLESLHTVISHIRKNYPKIKILAEKVETYDEFNQAKEMGFDFFQGYYFAKPEVIASTDFDVSGSTLMNIYVEAMKPELCFKRLSALFQCDLPLCYKLLNYVNSPSFATRVEIQSIKQALNFLGEDLLRRFVCLLVTSELSQDKPAELLNTSIYRARFCELIVKSTPFSNFSERAFLVGLFSTIDAVLDVNMATVMEKLPLDRDIKLALVQNVGLLAGALNIIKEFEKGNWDAVDKLAKNIDSDVSKVQRLYVNALLWSSKQQSALHQKDDKSEAA